MNTVYPGDRAQRCPIIHRCLKQLRATNAALAFDDDDETIASLTQRYESASGDPSYVRLRGFITIEAMLSMLKQVYVRGYGADSPFPSLEVRTWGGLTGLKRGLLEVLDRVSMDVTELRLQGVQFNESNVVFTPSKVGDEKDQVELSTRGCTAFQVQTLTAVVIHSVELLRPYLRNEEASVSAIGDGFGLVAREVHGVLARGVLTKTIQQLLDVRL